MERTGLVVVLIFLSVISICGQGVTWRSFRTADKLLTVSLPSETIIANVDDKVQLVSGFGEVSFTVVKQEVAESRKFVRNLVLTPNEKAEIPQIEESDATVKQISFNSETRYQTTIYIGSRSYLLTISASAKRKDDPVLIQFFGSLLLNGRATFGNPNGGEQTPPAVEIIEKLVSSKIVNEMLAMKCGTRVKVEYTSQDASSQSQTKVEYSRRLLILRTPKAALNGERLGSKKVSIRVLFKDDGCVGEALVIDGARGRETDAALVAVMNIKFLPAEIGGKPANSFKTMQYNF